MPPPLLLPTFLLLLLLPFLPFLSLCAYTTLSYSGKHSTQVTLPLSAPPIIYNLTRTPRIPQVPSALWFWSGDQYSPTCPMSITFQDNIYLDCLVQKVALYVGADNSFTASFLGATLTGNDYRVIYSVMIDPENFTCNGTYMFRITAVNNPRANTPGCSNGNSAGIIYGVMQEQGAAGGGCCSGEEYYYQRMTCECLPCGNLIENCWKCSNTSVCFECLKGYNLVNNECYSECGNGITTPDEQCDDNNTAPEDGCSPTCTIQPYYTCQTPPLHTSSCILNTTFRIYVKQVIKHFYQNKLWIVMRITPNATILNRIQMGKVFQYSEVFRDVVVKYQGGRGLIVFEGSYLEGVVDEEEVKVVWRPKGVYEEFGEIAEVKVDVSLVSNDNVPIVWYSKEVYELAETIGVWWKGLIMVSFGLGFVGSFTSKIPVIQYFNLLQISFFSLAFTPKVHPLLTNLFPYKHLNGYNPPISLHVERKVPDSIFVLGYNENILNNFMLSLIVIGILVVVFGGMYWGSFLLNKHRESMREVVRVGMEVVSYVGLFFSMCGGFSVGVGIRYGEGSLVDVVCYSTTIGMFALLVLYNLYFNKQQALEVKYKQHLKQKFHICLTLLFRLTLGFYIGISHYNPFTPFLTLSLSFCFFMYLLSSRPFSQAYHNYRSTLQMFTVVVVLFFRMMYGLKVRGGNRVEEKWIIWTGLGEIGFVSVCLGVSLGYVGWDIYKLSKSLRGKRSVKFEGEEKDLITR